ncbi:MFS transporter [Paraconexibacter algicola]|uniref:Major facilitator superfamily (MFS) profile domain-containing protein n=1 Tax=Paraconexibacter algicola TaxID=2133960 RepID=A0A2T4UGJ2_9ACTN|nr:MFS transporter [Paraconexibacter algicola]PTL58319.1 hypothetical protein C7Y72_00965 [Paraconexibacter algicola]
MPSIVEQSSRRAPLRIWTGAAVVYGIAAFAAALDGGRAPDDPAWSVVPFCAAFALAFLPWGAWADRHGAPAAMRASTLLLLVGGVVLLLPLGDGGWLVGRALEGLAAAGFPPAAQAALARLGGPGRAGRSIGGMSVAVAVGTLLVPLLAGLAEGPLGATATLALGAIGLPLVGLAAVATLTVAPAPAAAPTGRPAVPGRAPAAALRPTPGLLSAYACAFLVLIAYWTVVTRAAPLLGPDGAGLSESGARAVPLVGGLLGMVLTGVVAGVADRRGPRGPMVAVLAVGIAGLAVAASTGAPGAAVVGVAAFSLAYWCYLTLVGLQVVRSAPAAVHGRALGGLYTSMWTGAAVGGAVAATGAAWTVVLGLCAGAWTLAALVAARWFLAAAPRPAVPPRDAAPSAVDARLATSSR